MGNSNGKSHGENDIPPMQPMPQEGVYPLHKFCMWLECPMAELKARFAELGVPITNETADMAVLLAAIERWREDDDETEE